MAWVAITAATFAVECTVIVLLALPLTRRDEQGDGTDLGYPPGGDIRTSVVTTLVDRGEDAAR